MDVPAGDSSSPLDSGSSSQNFGRTVFAMELPSSSVDVLAETHGAAVVSGVQRRGSGFPSEGQGGTAFHEEALGTGDLESRCRAAELNSSFRGEEGVAEQRFPSAGLSKASSAMPLPGNETRWFIGVSPHTAEALASGGLVSVHLTPAVRSAVASFDCEVPQYRSGSSSFSCDVSHGIPWRLNVRPGRRLFENSSNPFPICGAQDGALDLGSRLLVAARGQPGVPVAPSSVALRCRSSILFSSVDVREIQEWRQEDVRRVELLLSGRLFSRSREVTISSPTALQPGVFASRSSNSALYASPGLSQTVQRCADYRLLHGVLLRELLQLLLRVKLPSLAARLAATDLFAEDPASVIDEVFRMQLSDDSSEGTDSAEMSSETTDSPSVVKRCTDTESGGASRLSSDFADVCLAARKEAEQLRRSYGEDIVPLAVSRALFVSFHSLPLSAPADWLSPSDVLHQLSSPTEPSLEPLFVALIPRRLKYLCSHDDPTKEPLNVMLGQAALIATPLLSDACIVAAEREAVKRSFLSRGTSDSYCLPPLLPGVLSRSQRKLSSASSAGLSSGCPGPSGDRVESARSATDGLSRRSVPVSLHRWTKCFPSHSIRGLLVVVFKAQRHALLSAAYGKSLAEVGAALCGGLRTRLLAPSPTGMQLRRFIKRERQVQPRATASTASAGPGVNSSCPSSSASLPRSFTEECQAFSPETSALQAAAASAGELGDAFSLPAPPLCDACALIWVMPPQKVSPATALGGLPRCCCRCSPAKKSTPSSRLSQAPPSCSSSAARTGRSAVPSFAASAAAAASAFSPSPISAPPKPPTRSASGASGASSAFEESHGESSVSKKRQRVKTPEEDSDAQRRRQLGNHLSSEIAQFAKTEDLSSSSSSSSSFSSSSSSFSSSSSSSSSTSHFSSMIRKRFAALASGASPFSQGRGGSGGAAEGESSEMLNGAEAGFFAEAKMQSDRRVEEEVASEICAAETHVLAVAGGTRIVFASEHSPLVICVVASAGQGPVSSLHAASLASAANVPYGRSSLSMAQVQNSSALHSASLEGLRHIFPLLHLRTLTGPSPGLGEAARFTANALNGLPLSHPQGTSGSGLQAAALFAVLLSPGSEPVPRQRLGEGSALVGFGPPFPSASRVTLLRRCMQQGTRVRNGQAALQQVQQEGDEGQSDNLRASQGRGSEDVSGWACCTYALSTAVVAPFQAVSTVVSVDGAVSTPSELQIRFLSEAPNSDTTEASTVTVDPRHSTSTLEESAFGRSSQTVQPPSSFGSSFSLHPAAASSIALAASVPQRLWLSYTLESLRLWGVDGLNPPRNFDPPSSFKAPLETRILRRLSALSTLFSSPLFLDHRNRRLTPRRTEVGSPTSREIRLCAAKLRIAASRSSFSSSEGLVASTSSDEVEEEAEEDSSDGRLSWESAERDDASVEESNAGSSEEAQDASEFFGAQSSSASRSSGVSARWQGGGSSPAPTEQDKALPRLNSSNSIASNDSALESPALSGEASRGFEERKGKRGSKKKERFPRSCRGRQRHQRTAQSSSEAGVCRTPHFAFLPTPESPSPVAFPPSALAARCRLAAAAKQAREGGEASSHDSQSLLVDSETQALKRQRRFEEELQRRFDIKPPDGASCTAGNETHDGGRGPAVFRRSCSNCSCIFQNSSSGASTRRRFASTAVARVCWRYVHLPLLRHRPLLILSDESAPPINCIGSDPLLLKEPARERPGLPASLLSAVARFLPLQDFISFRRVCRAHCSEAVFKRYVSSVSLSAFDLELPQLLNAAEVLQRARCVDCSGVDPKASIAPLKSAQSIQFLAAISAECRRFVFAVPAQANLAKCISRALGRKPEVLLHGDAFTFQNPLHAASLNVSQSRTQSSSPMQTASDEQSRQVENGSAGISSRMEVACQGEEQETCFSKQTPSNSPADVRRLLGRFLSPSGRSGKSVIDASPVLPKEILDDGVYSEQAGDVRRYNEEAAEEEDESAAKGLLARRLRELESDFSRRVESLTACPFLFDEKGGRAFSLRRLLDRGGVEDFSRPSSASTEGRQGRDLEAVASNAASAALSWVLGSAIPTPETGVFVGDGDALATAVQSESGVPTPGASGLSQEADLYSISEISVSETSGRGTSVSRGSRVQSLVPELPLGPQSGSVAQLDVYVHGPTVPPLNYRMPLAVPFRKLMRYYKDQANLRDDVVDFLWIQRGVVTRLLSDLSPLDYGISKGPLRLLAETRPSLQYAQKVWISLFIEGSEEAPFLPRLRFNASVMTPFSRLSESYSRNVGIAEGDLLLFYCRGLETVEVRLDKCPLDYDVRENDVVKVELRPGAVIPEALAAQYEQQRRQGSQL